MSVHSMLAFIELRCFKHRVGNYRDVKDSRNSRVWSNCRFGLGPGNVKCSGLCPAVSGRDFLGLICPYPHIQGEGRAQLWRRLSGVCCSNDFHAWRPEPLPQGLHAPLSHERHMCSQAHSLNKSYGGVILFSHILLQLFRRSTTIRLNSCLNPVSISFSMFLSI